jgi:hypothetical protein
MTDIIEYNGQSALGSTLVLDPATGLTYTWRDWVAKEQRQAGEALTAAKGNK